MSNAAKRRGTEWETAGVRYLREQVPGGDDIRRVAQTGRLDIGDAHARPFVLEFKNVAQINLAGFVDQANAEAGNAGLPYGVAVVKRRGKGAAHGYAVMDLATFARVLSEIREVHAEARENRALFERAISVSRANTPGGSGT